MEKSEKRSVIDFPKPNGEQMKKRQLENWNRLKEHLQDKSDVDPKLIQTVNNGIRHNQSKTSLATKVE
jgi:hypothetical protein